MDPLQLDGPASEALLAAAPVGLVLVEAPGIIAWANPAYFRATGRSPELLGREIRSIEETDGSWSPTIRAAVANALDNGVASEFPSVRARHRTRPGDVYLDIAVRPLSRDDGRPARVLVQVTDVTDRVTEHLRADLFYASFRSSTNPMQLTDAGGTMIDVNPAYEHTYGYSREECIGRKPNLVRSRYTPREVYERMWSDLSDPERGYWTGEILNRDRNGRERPVLLTVTAVRGNGGGVTHYLGVAVDQSERRDWEMRAAHSDKLASVGQLAAGVAHEINTPLANVMLVAESVRRRSQDPWVLARINTLTEQVETAARIVRSLLDFARRDEPRVTDLDLVEVARESVRFVRGKQSADTEVVEEYPGAPVPVAGDRQQLIQVFTNILNNAFDALDGPGTIRIIVRRTRDRAEVEVIDGGPGIRAEVLPHIFEPFFTTKPEGRGTGLGLAVCHGLVQSHHGSITARNAAGGGASFLVSLPIREAPSSPPRPP